MRIAGAKCGLKCTGCPRCDTELLALLSMNDEEAAAWLNKTQDKLFADAGIRRASEGDERVMRHTVEQHLDLAERVALATREPQYAPPPPDMRAAILAARGLTGPTKPNADLTPNERMRAALMARCR